MKTFLIKAIMNIERDIDVENDTTITFFAKMKGKLNYS